MKVSILSIAKNDLKEIRLFLSEYGEIPPKKFRDSFEKFCAQVVAMPYMFSQYEYNPSYRKAVIIFDYLVFYRVDESKGKIMIYRVLHGKRNIVPLLD
ncbi:MAG: type II toxin-antitoxin system RelE/ParE family toxin [Bacteroidetes bacterium]|nr:type II toxin-antitoxin system RelE/ParE family toxin [Bacteroidota bacterium]